ncbi:response regulator transcription factor [Methylobacter sp. YRD-M1]|uniref:response regulator transcription factor n=1 Tax=Methylobacter sp. YRD-M1 TaxID=2911520 RepID=UPI00227D6718|nr:response regulator [Methylobacter sp. YRD-M1]WAK00429.1 response regulator [Methylobacter sp. YRD-M1]
MELNIRTAIVYLVDKEFAIRDSLTLLLESTGRQVKSFDSAEAFLYNFDRTKPACLILDVRMPFMGGMELKKELSNKNINIPIIFISGDIDIPDSAKAFRCAALSFLEKPFDYKELLERIDDGIVNTSMNCSFCPLLLSGKGFQKSADCDRPQYIRDGMPQPLGFS